MSKNCCCCCCDCDDEPDRVVRKADTAELLGVLHSEIGDVLEKGGSIEAIDCTIDTGFGERTTKEIEVYLRV